MHSLETLERINREAAERELSRRYGHEMIARETSAVRRLAEPSTLQRLRAALLRLARELIVGPGAVALILALGSIVLPGCREHDGPATPDIAGPCPPPEFVVTVPVAGVSVPIVLRRIGGAR